MITIIDYLIALMIITCNKYGQRFFCKLFVILSFHQKQLRPVRLYTLLRSLLENTRMSRAMTHQIAFANRKFNYHRDKTDMQIFLLA